MDRYPEIAAQLALKKHPGLDISTITFGSDKKYYWICDRDKSHFPYQSVSQRVRGSGCNFRACINAKQRENYFRKTGFDHPLRNPAIRRQQQETYAIKTGYHNPFSNPEVKQKIRNTSLLKFGHEHATQNNDIKQKRKRTFQERYNYDHPSKIPEIKEKKKLKAIQNFGCDHPMKNPIVKAKFANTCMGKYGFQTSALHPDVQKKRYDTCTKKYGFPNPMQNAIIAQKVTSACFTSKMFRFPNREVSVQGFEHHALKLLLDSGVSENDIVVEKPRLPQILYILDGIQRRYYPDIFILSQNHFIEVKSEYTVSIDKKRNQKKLDATRAAGHSISIWVMNKHGQLLREVENVE